jgi:hypothetical protein
MFSLDVMGERGGVRHPGKTLARFSRDPLSRPLIEAL